jgi:hypothetical protein
VTGLPENFSDLVEHWTLLESETDLLATKRGATRLGFAVLLKFYGRYGRFPRGRAEVKQDAVEFVAAQVKMPAADLGLYDWDGPTIKRHRAEIRRFFGFREFTVDDAAKLTDWLAGGYAQRVRRPELVREQFLAECRTRQLEPPTSGRTDRIVNASLARAADTVAARVAGRLDAGTLARLLGLVEVHDPDTDAEADEDPSLLRWLKSSTGDISLSAMHDDVDKLEAIRSFALPAKLLAEVAPKVVAEWRNQAMIESPSHMRRHAEPLRAAMLAALLVNRQQEITDQLVRLLVGAVRRIGLRAEKKVAREMVNQFTRGRARSRCC